MARLQIGEIYLKMKNPEMSIEQKAQVLKNNDCSTLRDIVQIAFNDKLKLNIGVDRVSYSDVMPYIAPNLQTTIMGEWGRIKRLFITPVDRDPRKDARRQVMFHELLKSLPIPEGQLLVDLYNGEAQIPHEAVAIAYPGYIQNVPVQSVTLQVDEPKESSVLSEIAPKKPRRKKASSAKKPVAKRKKAV